MKVKDFFECVKSAEDLCSRIGDNDVEVRLFNKHGVYVTDLDLNTVSYMFSPVNNGQPGAMVLEVQIN